MKNKILMLPGNPGFNESLRSYLETHYNGQQDFIDVITSQFSSGEMHAQIKESVRGKHVFVVQSSSGSWDIPKDFGNRVLRLYDDLEFLSSHPDENVRAAAQRVGISLAGIEIADGISRTGLQKFLSRQFKRSVNDDFMTLVVALDALKRANPSNIQAVLPFLLGQRQDRKDKPRVPITGKAIFDILQKVGGNKLDNIITSELHVPQAQGFFDGAVDNLPMTWIFAADIIETIKRNNIDRKKVIFVSPDLGGEKRCEAILEELASYIEPHIGVFKKSRLSDQGTVQNLLVPDNDSFTMENVTVFMIDDIVDSANSLVTPAKALKRMGARRVYGYAAHGVLTEKAVDNLTDAALNGLVVTNTLAMPPYMESAMRAGKLSQMGVHPFFAEVIVANSSDSAMDGSVSEMFSMDAVRDFCRKGGIPLGQHIRYG